MNPLDGLPDLRQAIEELIDRRIRQALASVTAETMSGYVDVEGAAAYLGVPVGRVRKLVASRSIPFHQEDAGCRITFGLRDLDQWMSISRVEPKGGDA
jgi:excisionase family DNA binding protein